jgi:hypothetical protein
VRAIGAAPPTRDAPFAQVGGGDVDALSSESGVESAAKRL